MTANNLKALRDTARQQMEMAKKLGDPETYKAAKAIYSRLCADYFDNQHGQQS